MENPSKQRLGWEAAGSLLGAFVAALLICLGANAWFPPGEAGIDAIVVPGVFFPLIWLACALALYAAPNQRRARAVVGGAALLSLVAVASQLGS
ncbi:hypothetical protein G6O69_02065 [Pseudenhygromyxa sp. WMMC2535]|uniref:hypothetical protein n=1 Tax=Pseudenhygromyxa sp. WMMC2535 TaxID=2712867 RepID=UPI001555C237|nr:hypothetical protein [Pseudenhygromyxa sp. WMMC2535]NVB36600.1 hypothetical protein [Pseudenhygromyxa sp. WMMC2535]